MEGHPWPGLGGQEALVWKQNSEAWLTHIAWFTLDSTTYSNSLPLQAEQGLQEVRWRTHSTQHNSSTH